MQLLDKAIEFAVKAHAGQLRKGKDTPYITHPLSALVVASSITSDQEVLSAVVLHDTVEDTEVTSEDIVREFGLRVAKLVLSDSEDKLEHLPAQSSWQTRKQITVDEVATMTFDEQIVCIADKLANLREIAQDYAKLGDDLFTRFNQKDKSKHAWYYRSIWENLHRLKDAYAYREYERLLEEVFGD